MQNDQNPNIEWFILTPTPTPFQYCDEFHLLLFPFLKRIHLLDKLELIIQTPNLPLLAAILPPRENPSLVIL
jgi:hypothetical protein